MFVSYVPADMISRSISGYDSMQLLSKTHEYQPDVKKRDWINHVNGVEIIEATDPKLLYRCILTAFFEFFIKPFMFIAFIKSDLVLFITTFLLIR